MEDGQNYPVEDWISDMIFRQGMASYWYMAFVNTAHEIQNLPVTYICPKEER